MVAELGLHYYRFSISWPRLLPKGFDYKISETGKAYYNNLIDGLLKKGIEPLITIYHFDLPQSLQDLGGWTNPLIVDWFADYARVVFSLFGDRVKMWLTINEPIVICDMTYKSGTSAPGIYSPYFGAYLCNKYVLLAHAKAWRVYDEEFKPKYHGKVSLAQHLLWIEPATDADQDLAEFAMQVAVGRYSHPIYSEKGGWPPGLEKVVEELSKKRGLHKSVLPAFTQEEIELIRGTHDYYGFNLYTSRLIKKKTEDSVNRWPQTDAADLGAVLLEASEWGKSSVVNWLSVHPEAMRRQLKWLKKNYGDLEYVITENGMATNTSLHDEDRINYYKSHLMQVLLAIKEDGVNVTHYTAWSLMDNFEWMYGYSVRFGLYEVDYSDPKRTRTPRQSAKFYKNVIKSNSLDVPTE
ncbi:unnamed protein product [Chrysodeixis includens]|uniref:Glycosyl hydrolase n=1 Tax=Chrysodeixis includens TaxID=689277 RepID=A0A9P0FT77_CHRIL|nr:unnamed protein product [Chrysodeixis includens]